MVRPSRERPSFRPPYGWPSLLVKLRNDDSGMTTIVMPKRFAEDALRGLKSEEQLDIQALRRLRDRLVGSAR